jgi:hypothetical protein
MAQPATTHTTMNILANNDPDTTREGALDVHQEPANDAGDGDPNQSPLTFDPETARRSYALVAPRWNTTVLDRYELPRCNIEFVASRVIQIARRATGPGLYEDFQRMPRFEVAHLDALTLTAWGLWHARTEYRRADAVASDALLPTALVAEATAVRDRMWKCADYNVGDLPAARKELDSIAEVDGSRYLDLAMDLARLALVYEHALWAAQIALDRKRYQPEDIARARTLSGTIVHQLQGASDPVGHWTRQIACGWSALQTHYAEVAHAGRFLERHDDTWGTYPELFAIRRATSSSGSAKTPDGPEKTPVP